MRAADGLRVAVEEGSVRRPAVPAAGPEEPTMEERDELCIAAAVSAVPCVGVSLVYVCARVCVCYSRRCEDDVPQPCTQLFYLRRKCLDKAQVL